MLRYMLRQLIKQVILLFSLFSCFAAFNVANADAQTELINKFVRAQNLAQTGEVDQAINIYKSLIQENPKFPEAYNNLAALYLKKKDTKQAKHILEQGLYAHKGYGVLYESLTAINVAMAREAYSKALQIELKPADVTIASLSLNNKERSEKSTIVISKDIKPVEKTKKSTLATLPSQEKVNSKIAVNDAAKVKLSGEIRRVAITTKPVKKTETIETILQAWSAAWSAQAVDMYLSFYHNNFKPSNGLSRNGWEQSRRIKLKKPSWIKVGLSNFDIVKNDGRQVIVKFKQSYQSDRYSDVSSKRMVLLYTNSGWRIFQEKSI